MKKNINIIITVAALLILSTWMTACNKKDESPAKSRTELLTQSPWVYQSLAFYVNGEPTTIPLTEETENLALEATLGGSSITLNADGTLTSTNGQDDVEGTWNLTSDESAIIIKIDQLTTTLTIIELTETILKARMNAEVFLGENLSLEDTVEVEFTFTH